MNKQLELLNHKPFSLNHENKERLFYDIINDLSEYHLAQKM